MRSTKQVLNTLIDGLSPPGQKLAARPPGGQRHQVCEVIRVTQGQRPRHLFWPAISPGRLHPPWFPSPTLTAPAAPGPSCSGCLA